MQRYTSIFRVRGIYLSWATRISRELAVSSRYCKVPSAASSGIVFARRGIRFACIIVAVYKLSAPVLWLKMNVIAARLKVERSLLSNEMRR